MQYRTDHHRFPKNVIDEAYRLCSTEEGQSQSHCMHAIPNRSPPFPQKCH